MDEMTVLAEARPERWDGSGLPAHAEKVSAFIKNTIGISARVGIVAPETLERSSVIRVGRSLFQRVLESDPAAARRLRDEFANRTSQIASEILMAGAKLGN